MTIFKLNNNDLKLLQPAPISPTSTSANQTKICKIYDKESGSHYLLLDIKYGEYTIPYLQSTWIHFRISNLKNRIFTYLRKS